MKRTIKKLISVIITLSLVLPCVPIAYAESDDSVIDFAAMQEKFKKDFEKLNKKTATETAVDEITEEEQAVLDEINNNPISTVENNNDTDSGILTVETNVQISPSAVATPAPETVLMSAVSTIETTVPDEFKIESVNSVYNVLNNNNDYVSQATGALTYEKTLLSLPGRNGLDLNLSVKYNSEDAVITQNEFEETDEDVRKINFNSFAAGWSFGFPTIIKSSVKKGYGWRKETSLVFPDGSGYQIKNDTENPSTDTTLELEFYNLSDMTLVKKANTNNYELTYSNGTVYTFDGVYGNIIKITDVFGNTINFTYTELDYYRGTFLDYVFSPSFYTAKLNTLTKIVDSTGRQIDIDYDIKKTGSGQEIRHIYIRLNGTTYATLTLDHISNYEGVADVLTQITDAEGYTTKFTYDEKITHIFRRNMDNVTDFSYTVNGSVMALTKVDLPTGGWVAYEYTKARRAYTYYVPYVAIADWYEIFKVSKVSDSGGFERTYEYENDRSGYPYSHLLVEPLDVDYNYYLDPNTGNVKDTMFRYFCLIRENGRTTVSTFDYQHNKIKEQVYDDTNTQNSYVTGRGRETSSVVVGNYIYHMGTTNTSIAKGANSKYFYRQNIVTGQTEFLTPSPNTVSSTMLKSCGNTIFLFYRDNSGYMNAVAYDISTDTWSEAGKSTMTFTSGGMYYAGGKFWFYKFQNSGSSTKTLQHLIYDPSISSVNNRWQYKNSAQVGMLFGDFTKFTYSQTLDEKTYYINGQYVIEYNRDADTATLQQFSNSLLSYGATGFSFNGKTYAINGGAVNEFDYATRTIVNSYTMPASLLNNYYVQKGSDGYTYFVQKRPDASYNCPVYKFTPGFETAFTKISDLMVTTVTLTDPEKSATPVLIAGNGCLYLKGDGIETIKLTEPTKTQSTTLTSTFYNDYKQPTSNVITRYSGTQQKNGGTESYTYIEGKSVISSTTDILGNVTTYEYTDSPYYIPTKTTQYAGTENALETVYTLSADKTKVETTETYYDDVTLKTVYEYNDTTHPGNVTKETVYQAQPNTTEYTIVSQKEYSYDSTGTFIERTTQKNVETNDNDFTLSSAHDITTSKTYNVLGLVTSETDALGRTTQYSYNNNGWQTGVVYPDNTTKDIKYRIGGSNDMSNRITTVYDNGYTAIDYYDELGLPMCHGEVTPEGKEVVNSAYYYYARRLYGKYDAFWNMENYLYDAFDRVTGVLSLNDDFSVISAEKYASYDDFNLSSTLNNGGKTSTTYYDIAGREIRTETPTNAGLAVSHTTYDYMGNVNSTTTPKGEKTLYSYNDRGLLVSATDALGGVVSYTYDVLGNPLTVTNAGQLIQTNTYDNIGRVLTTTDALGYVEKYSYDNHGRMIKSIDRNGETTSFEYKPNTDYLQKQTTGNVVSEYTYDDLGNVLTATNATGTYQYGYTFNNLLESITYPDNKSITYAYDGNRNITEVTDYSGDVIKYTYDGAQNVTSISRDDSVVVYYEYNRDRTVKTADYPRQGTTHYLYDNAMRLTCKANIPANGGYTEYNHNYEYDLNGNIIHQNDFFGDTYYTYDKLGRLSEYSDSTGEKETYTYDSQGNISTKSLQPGQFTEGYTFKQDGTEYTLSGLTNKETIYFYDQNNRLISETEHISGYGNDYTGFIEVTHQNEYDNNGNLLKATKGGQVDEETKTYSYNALNRLIEFKDGDNDTTSYAYNPDGLRTSKTHNGISTKFYWDRNYMSAESVNGNIIARNYIGIDGIFARETNAGTDYMFKNGHGDVSITTKAGTKEDEFRYRPFGEKMYPSDETDNPYGYCGEYLDEESGLIYLRNRYYDPEIGRFITEDPIKDGMNWYAYCGNNPVNMVDPSGLDSYILYTTGKGSDFSEQAEWQKGYLESQGERVIMRTVNDYDSFIFEWNMIGYDYDIQQNVTVNKIIIYSHGNDRTLILEDNSATKALSIDGENSMGYPIGNLSYLEYKYANYLEILSCNAGNLDPYFAGVGNVASILSQKISGVTHAYDGNVSFGRPVWQPWGENIGMSSRLSTTQFSFNEIVSYYGKSGRYPKGKLTYFNGEYKPYGYHPNTSISAGR